MSKINDIYKEVTQKIVMNLKEGIIPWRQHWASPLTEKFNYKTKRKYNGINQLLLKEPGEYLTFNQCKEAGGNVKKHEKAHIIYQWIPYVKPEDKKEFERRKKAGEDTDDLIIPILKHLPVFHISQTEGIKSKIESQNCTKAESPTIEANICLERMCVNIQEEDTNVCLMENDNTLHVPKRSQFRTEEQWYNTVFGQIAKSRLTNVKENSPLEELTAEMAACMVMTGVGLDAEAAFEDTLHDCSYWAQQLDSDTRLVIKAAGTAQKIAEEILSPIYG